MKTNENNKNALIALTAFVRYKVICESNWAIFLNISLFCYHFCESKLNQYYLTLFIQCSNYNILTFQK